MFKPTNHFPVLMYHGITSEASSEIPAGWSPDHCISLEMFRKQLDTLVSESNKGRSVANLNASKAKVGTLSITFDDGCVSDFSLAAPELAHRNLHATFFPIWSYLGHPGYMRREQVIELNAMGFEIGSHGMSHKQLSLIGPQEVWREVLESKNRFEDLLGHSISSFAVPFGHYNDFVLQAAWAAGYERIFTSDFGLNKIGNQVLSRICITQDVKLNHFSSLIKAHRLSSVRQRFILKVRRWRNRHQQVWGDLLSSYEFRKPRME